MLIKPGVDISRLRPEIRKRLNAINKLYESVNEELVITSTYEGNHSAGTLHYANLAIDIRRPKDERTKIHEGLRRILDDNYDIVFEGTHIHIEFDPPC